MANRPQKQMKLGAMKPQAVGNTPELLLTHRGTGVPVLQDSSIMQHLNAVYTSYGGGIDDALGRLAMESPAVKRSRQKRHRRSSVGGSQPSSQQQEDDDDDDPTLQMRGSDTRNRTVDVQFDAGHYLDQLADYTSTTRMPPQSDLLRLETIMQRHALHNNEQPAQHAFRLLLSYIQRFPATQMRHFPADSAYAGLPYIEERDNAWTVVNRKWRLVQTEDTEEEAHVTADQFFFHLWECAACLAENVELPENVANHYGQVLLLRAVVAQLQAELAPRLAAFHGTAGPGAAARAAAGETGRAAAARRDGLLRHRRRLLEESHLWRLLKEVPLKGIRSRYELVARLVAIIGASADTPAAGEVAGDSPQLVTVQELAGLAGTMLRMMLELYGTAEASGYYCDAAGRIRNQDTRNHRILLDTFLLEFFIGSESVLKGWERKQALLVALRPRDRLRLLGLVVAKRRVQRGEADARRFVSMQTARDLVHGTGDTPGFIDIDPVEVLTYIADDLNYAQSAFNRSANELALVAAHIGRAAASFRPDAAAEVAAALERVSSAMLARHGEGEKANRLSANSRAELRSAGVLLQAAASAGVGKQ